MKVSSHNEWSPLKSVIVGTASYANFPANNILHKAALANSKWRGPLPAGPVPQWIIDETNEDLDVLASTLINNGISVSRPVDFDYQVLDSQYGYCPRDNLLVIGNKVIEVPMSLKIRQLELQGFQNIKRDAVFDGAAWLRAPEAQLRIGENLVNKKFKLNELEPVFDAANICRFDSDLLYLVSSSANRMGAIWLQNLLGSQYNVHVTDVYDSAHIDSTIVPISDDDVILNADRVNAKNLPTFLKDWNHIYITENMINPQGFTGYPYASKWIAINMLALGNKTVICDKNQPKIIDELDKHGFTVIPLELRHSRTLGGGFHCVTLDLLRE